MLRQPQETNRISQEWISQVAHRHTRACCYIGTQAHSTQGHTETCSHWFQDIAPVKPGLYFWNRYLRPEFLGFLQSTGFKGYPRKRQPFVRTATWSIDWPLRGLAVAALSFLVLRRYAFAVYSEEGGARWASRSCLSLNTPCTGHAPWAVSNPSLFSAVAVT